MVRTSFRRARLLAMSATCVAINVGLGKASNLMGLPFTADTVGTILGAALLPWPVVLLVGIASSMIGAAIIHPAFIYYIGTQVAIGLVAVALMRLGWFRRAWSALVAGIVIGLVSAVVSAPVTAIVFGGVSVPSITAINAVMLASGKSLWTSVLTGALIVESIDKAAAGLLAWLISTRLPSHMVRSRRAEADEASLPSASSPGHRSS